VSAAQIISSSSSWRRIHRRRALGSVRRGRIVEIGTTVEANGRQQVLRNASYHPFGPVAEWIYGNGRVMKRTQNLNGQPGVVQPVTRTPGVLEHALNNLA
jgi:hypothetical protein